MKKKLILLILLSISMSTFGATKFVVNNGHFSPIVDMKYDKVKDLIFTVEKKGALSVWNRSEESLIHHFQLSDNTIIKVLINDNNIAVLSQSHDNEKFNLTVWDWKLEKKIFTRIIEEEPLFLEYSTTGKYLFYGSATNPSLTFINGGNGIKLDLLSDLPSIYDFGYIGSSEKRILTYSSSGSLRQYDIRTKKKIASVNTVRGLYNLNVLQTGNKGIISARQDNKLFLINRGSGSTVDSMEFEELKHFYQNRSTGFIITFERANRKNILRKWSTANGTFTEIEKEILLPNSFNIHSFLNTDFYDLAGDGEGTLFKINWVESNFEDFSSNNSKNISDILISGSKLTLSSTDGLLTIESPFFDNNPSSFTSPVFNVNENISTGENRILELDDDKILIWNIANKDPSALIIDSNTGAVSFEYNDFTSPIKDIAYIDGKIITLELNGTIKVINESSKKVDFTYSAIGLESISMIDANTLFAGRSSTAGKSSAITINTKTYETMPVTDNRFLIFDSLPVKDNNKFYSLGLEFRNNKTITVLKSHDYNNLNDMKSLIEYIGEDTNAQVLIDPAENRIIYAKFGTSGIYRINGGKYIKYKNNKPVKRIYIRESILYCLNQDNSITLFNASTGALIYSIFIFKDDSWALIPTSSDIYFGSIGVEQNIISFRKGKKIDLLPISRD
ncbi:MAG: WD40 repeat domain-containing protein [Deltaproteobacteria bacterium]|nr:WD40 repeat domain-containing protein [Deltaproteobacteria bacterium]